MEQQPMTPEQAKHWVLQWKRAAPFLEEQRERDIRASDTQRDIRAFDGLLRHALKNFPPGPDSGMVEMQKYFMRFMQTTRSKDSTLS